MKQIFILCLLMVGFISITAGQSTPPTSKSEQIDAQLEKFKESLDTIDIAKIIDQIPIPLGKDRGPSEQTIQEIEQGVEKMIGMMEKIDISEMEAVLQAFLNEMGTVLGDLDIPQLPTPPSTQEDQESSSKKEIKKI